MKLTQVLHACKRMFPTKNDIKSMQSQTNVFRYIASYGEDILKPILRYFYCVKCNEIIICHLDVQKPIFYEK